MLEIARGHMNLEDHLEKLKYFYEVARLGSLKQASQSVFISQPSLTKSIKVLEEVVGSPLFIRLPRGMKLTLEGEILYEYGHKLFASLTDIEQKLTSPEDPFSSSLRIGTYDSIGIYFWPKFLQNFLIRHPQLDIELTTGRSHEIQQKLEAGSLDLAMIIDPKMSSNIEIINLRSDSFKLYQASSSKKVFKNINEATVIAMPSASAGVQSVKELLAPHGFGGRKVFTTSSLESAKELTLHGLGIGLLPKMVAKSAVESGKLKEVRLKSFPSSGIGFHKVCLAYPLYRKDSAVIQATIEEIKKAKF